MTARGRWQGAVGRYARRIRALLVSDVTLLIALTLMAIVLAAISGLLTIRWLQAEGLWN